MIDRKVVESKFYTYRVWVQVQLFSIFFSDNSFLLKIFSHKNNVVN